MGQKRLGVVRITSKSGIGSDKGPERTGGGHIGVQLSKDEKLYHQSQISFFSAIFQGIASKLFKLSSSCFFGYYTRRKEEEASSIVKGKEPGRRFIKQALGHWKEHASVSSPGDLEEVRLEQIKELYTLNGTS